MKVEEAPNPLAEGLHDYRVADPAVMVIFGATGDLSGRKLLPALYNLAKQRSLPAGFAVVGTGETRRGPWRKQPGILLPLLGPNLPTRSL